MYFLTMNSFACIFYEGIGVISSEYNRLLAMFESSLKKCEPEPLNEIEGRFHSNLIKKTMKPSPRCLFPLKHSYMAFCYSRIYIHSQVAKI